MELDVERGYALAATFASLGEVVGALVLDGASSAVSTGMPGSQVGRIIPSMATCAADATRSVSERMTGVQELVNSAVSTVVEQDQDTGSELASVGAGVR